MPAQRSSRRGNSNLSSTISWGLWQRRWDLRTRVLANLPEREAWLEWLTVKAWRPVALAMVPLVIGFGVGLNVAQGATTQSTVEDDVLLALFDPDELSRYELPDTNKAERP